MKISVVNILICLALSLLVSCSKEMPKTIDLGTVEDGIYSNKYFDFSLDLSDGWQVQENQTMKLAQSMGKKIISGDDKNLEAALDLSTLTTVNLLLATKHPFGTQVAFNPNIAAVAEKIDPLSGQLSGREYLTGARKIMEMSKIETAFDDEISSVNLGGVDFDVMTVEMNYQNRSLTQKYYAAIMREYALAFIISYTTDEELRSLEELLGTMKFN